MDNWIIALEFARGPSLLDPVFFKSDNFDCFTQKCVRSNVYAK